MKVYSFQPTQEELLEIKRYLGQFFADRLTSKIEASATQQGITEADLEQWLNDKAQ